MNERPLNAITTVGACVVGTALLWSVIDGWRAVAGGASLSFASAMMLAGVGAAIGFVVAVAAVLVGISLRVIVPPPTWVGRRGVQLAAGAPWAAVGLMVLSDLASGPGIRAQPAQRMILLIGGSAASVLAAWFIGAAMLAVFGRRGGARNRFITVGVLGLLAAVACAIVDAKIYPRQYAVFHRGLAFMAATAMAACGAAVFRVALGRSAQITVGVLGAMAGVAAVLAFASNVWPGSDPNLRSLLRLQAPMTARVAGLVLPRSATVEDDGSRTLFTRPTPVPTDVLDRWFPDRRRMNVLWITIDTLRADHVGWAGYEPPTTPNLDAFAREAVVFNRAYTQYPSSQLSMASMFQGIYPQRTEVFTRRETPASLSERLSQPPIAERLGALGYTTEAVCALKRQTFDAGFTFLRQGFDQLNPFPWKESVDGESVTRRATEALARTSDQPWMVWAHYYDPHAPYVDHEDDQVPGSGQPAYDSEIRYVDRHLGALLETVRQRPDWDRTMVIIHADHGEEFLDHGGTHHGSSLYEEQVHIPLIVRMPGVEARATDHVVELVDLVPTILEAVGATNEGLHGQSLLRVLLGAEACGPGVDPPSAAFFQFDERHATSPHVAGVRFGRHKAMHHLRSDVLELYDLDADPDEQRDLAAEDTDTADTFRALLANYRAVASGDEAASPEVVAARDLAMVAEAADPSVARFHLFKYLTEQRAELAASCIDALLDRDEPGFVGLGLEAWCIRPPRDADVGRLLPLCNHADAAVRARAALAIAALPLTRVPDELVTLSADAAPLAKAATHLARGLLGDARVLPVLQAFMGQLTGRPRGLAIMALARLRDPEALERFRSLLAQQPVDLELHMTALRVVQRLDDPQLAVALFTSIEGRAVGSWWMHASVLIPALSSSPRAVRAPLLRLSYLRRDAGSRASIREVIGQDARTPWANAGIQVVQMRSDDDAKAADAFLGACRRSQKTDLVDWPHAVYAWRRLIAAGRRDRAVEIADEVELAPGDTTWSAAFVRRLGLLAKSLDRPPKLALEFLHREPPPTDPTAIGLVEIRVTASADGGGVIGGHPKGATHVFLALLDDAGGRPLASATLPVRGLLPGESTVVTIAFPWPTRRAGKLRLRASATDAAAVVVDLE